MNIEQAKAVPLGQILEKLGYQPTRQRNHEAVYFSPLRNEKTPSFHVNHSKNLWFDFGEGIGGNALDLVVAYLKSQNDNSTVSSALRWLSDGAGNVPVTVRPVSLPLVHKEPKLLIKNISAIKHRALISYLSKRGIAKQTAAACMKELRVLNLESKKEFFALGFPNEEQGYEIRNPFFKSCAGTKAISFIRGKQPKPDGLHIFEGSFDYLSAITYKQVNQFDDDSIVLNSLSCLKQAFPYIKGYGYRVAYSWLDNDKAGKKGMNALTEFFNTEERLQHKQMNSLYLPHKDVNAWHMHRLNLSL